MTVMTMMTTLLLTAKSDFDITKLFRIVMDGDVQDSPELTDALWYEWCECV